VCGSSPQKLEIVLKPQFEQPNLGQLTQISLEQVVQMSNDLIQIQDKPNPIKENPPTVKTKASKIYELITTNNPLSNYLESKTSDINSLILLDDVSLDKLYKKVVKYGPECDRFSKMVTILKNYKTRSCDKKTIPPMIRQAVWNKYIGKLTEGKCYCCGITEISSFNFDAGHVVAENCGGLITVENLRPICSSCNKSMNDQDMRKYAAIYYPESLLLKEPSSS
jgi:5-methylcytosine-specific restriction endonuclease McrA